MGEEKPVRIPESWSEDYQYRMFRALLKKEASKFKLNDNSPAQFTPLKDYIDQARHILAHKGEVQGIATNYPSLDSKLQGITSGELIVIGGSTGTGKTMFALNLIANAYIGSPQMFTTLIVTMEMTKPQVTARLLEIIDSSEYAGSASAFPILFYDHPVAEPTIKDIRTLVMKMKQEIGCQVVLIDHLHCFARSLESQANELGVIVRDLKKIAIDLEVAIVLVSHIRKSAPGQSHKEPTMDDLRGSSFIAQDADVVIMLRRDREDPDLAHELKVNVEKNRNKGETGSLSLAIDPKTHVLSDLETWMTPVAYHD